MIKRITSVTLTVCVFVFLSVILSVGALAASASLNVGTTYSETLLQEIQTDTTEITLTSPKVQTDNGITLTLEVSNKTIKVLYSGTPLNAETTTFDVSYTDGGSQKSTTAQFNVAAAVHTPDTPVIKDRSPSSIPNPVRKTDGEIVFSVTATGNGTISYEWLLDGVSVSHESKYTFYPSSASVKTHHLECVVTNTLGDTSKHTTTESPSWEIVVEEGVAPSITSSTSAAEINGTGSVRFTVEASGEGLSYQWYIISGSSKEKVSNGKYGNIEYSGGTDKTLKITCSSAPKTVTTKFLCVVTNGQGLSASTGEYILYVTEDSTLSRVQSISVSKNPTKTSYTVGETLDTKGMEVSVVTGKGTEAITTGFVCSPLLFETAGTQKITVSYGGKTTTFNVTVKEADHEHEWSEWAIKGSDVYRECKVDGCDAKETFTKEDFIKKYPEEAKKLGLEAEEEEKPEVDDTEEEPTVDDTKTETPKKTSSNLILWVIIIAAVILLVAACIYYFKIYRKPYKKPKNGVQKAKASQKRRKPSDRDDY